MCGIAGMFLVRRDGESEGLVIRIVRDQYRRGPDAQAVETVHAQAPQVVLGHNRLSIVDLSTASNQPLWDHERRCCIVYNGEIYNYLELRAELQQMGHRFVTTGDSEVLLEAFKEWGIGAVQRFIGMFAFALWDAVKEELWLVRDRFGVKPLYFHQERDGVRFASTPTVLGRELGLAPNIDYLADGIELRMYERDGPDSPFIGLQALIPGCWLKISRRLDGALESRQQRYYDLSAAVAVRRDRLIEQSDANWIDEVGSCLESAIELRLRSDVPMGLSLSGGIDSSTIAALATRRHDQITAFSFGSPEDAFSEGPNVAAIARKVGLAVHYCQPTMAEIKEAVWTTLDAQGAPYPSASIVAQNFVFKAARQTGVIVLLGGQGADEALMGYHKFKIFLLQQAWREKRLGRTIRLAGGVMALLAAELGGIGGYWRERHRFKAGSRSAPSLFARRAATEINHGMGELDSVWQRQVLDITRFSLPTLLRYEDRNSMGHSIESRLPFMDHRFVELGLSLPDVMKVRFGMGKWVLRQVARDLIPEDIRTTRKKRGFDVNHRMWIEKGLGNEIREKLHEGAFCFRDYLERPISVADCFPDHRLIEDPKAFPEAMSLIWLSRIQRT